MRDAVLHLLLLSLWGGAAAVGALAVSAALRRAHTPSRWLCWLWLAVGVRFALPWGIPLTLPRPQNQQLAQAAETVQALAEAPAPVVRPAVQAAPVQAAPAPWYEGLTVWHLLAAVWALGVLVLAVRAVAGYVRLRRTVALACKTPEGCYSGSCVPAPFTLGILRPRIYLPGSLTGAARQAVLLHERTHLRRRDPVVKPLYYAVVCLHWFNPLAWLAFRQLEREMEAACDEAAVRGCDAAARNAYCESLLQYALQGRMTPASLAFGQGSVKQRIVHLLHYRRLGAGALLLCAVAVGLSVTACMMRPQVAEATPETAAGPAAETGPQPATPETAVTFTPNTAGLPNLDDPANSPRFLCPVEYTYISRYMGGGHRGNDLCAPAGTPVYAAQDGYVESATYHWSWGNFVQLDHGSAADGRRWGTLYAHMRSLAVEPGQTVKAGDLLGYVGATGNTTGNALHFEMTVDDVLADARYFTDYREGDGSELTGEIAAELRARCDGEQQNAVTFAADAAGLPNLDDPANSALFMSPLQNFKYISAVVENGHQGVDIAADAGTPVYAAADGVVTVSEADATFGNWVEIDHGTSADGHRWTTRYAHMDDRSVQMGQTVQAGELVGHVGSTGQSTGPHLHFEVLADSAPVDPRYVTGAPLTSHAALTGDQAAEIKAAIQELQQDQQEAEQEARDQLEGPQRQLEAVQQAEDAARAQSAQQQLAQEADEARAALDEAAGMEPSKRATVAH